jgi:hypothetical protein
MTLHALKAEIHNLDWLHIKEKERHMEIKNRDVHEEANKRGSLVLTDILNLSPEIKKINSISQMSVKNPETGDFRFRVGFDFYTTDNSNLTVVKYCTIPNTHMSKVITDIDILMTTPSKQTCYDYQSSIREILNSYSVKDSLNEQHNLTIKMP